MHSRCLVCNATFSPGALVEHLPVGRRVAYDPERGRLWIICASCGGWTLWPMARRWEALEALEGIVTTRGRRGAQLKVRTGNVAVFRAGATDVIRLGDTSLLEEAAWRYGDLDANPFGPRPLRMGEWMLVRAYRLRTSLSSTLASATPADARRWVRYGDLAWKGKARCASCGLVLRQLSFSQARILILRDAGEEGVTPSLTRACPRCGDESQGGLHLDGAAAEFTLRRYLARQQDRGVPDEHLRAAAHLIELGGGASGISSILARYGRYVGELPITSAVALRVLANEACERRLLALEADALERRWSEEEALASVIDGDLTPIPTLEGVRRLLRERRWAPAPPLPYAAKR